MGFFILPKHTSWIDLSLFGHFWPCCFLCINLHTALKWLVFPAFTTHFAIGRALSLGMFCSTVSTAFYSFLLLMPHIVTSLCILSIESKSLASFILSNAAFCALRACTIWAHITIHSLVASSVSANADISHSISLIMPSLSSPCIHCSVISNHIHYSHIPMPLFAICLSTPGQQLMWM